MVDFVFMIAIWFGVGIDFIPCEDKLELSIVQHETLIDLHSNEVKFTVQLINISTDTLYFIGFEENVFDVQFKDLELIKEYEGPGFNFILRNMNNEILLKRVEPMYQPFEPDSIFENLKVPIIDDSLGQDSSKFMSDEYHKNDIKEIRNRLLENTISLSPRKTKYFKFSNNLDGFELKNGKYSIQIVYMFNNIKRINYYLIKSDLENFKNICVGSIMSNKRNFQIGD